MRDIFQDLNRDAPRDPMEAARRNMRPKLPRRFYRAAGTSPGAEGHRVLLDGRPARTPARHVLAAPTPALAEALAAEWDAQGEEIDPAAMPLTRLANAIIDAVAPAPAPVRAEIARYLASDLLCYRAEQPERLVERQGAQWDPVLAWAREALGARFVLGAGVTHVAQPPQALEAAARAIPADPWRLGAAHVMTTLTGSALLALAVLQGRLTGEEAWGAAHVDEDWNLELWGRDELALSRRAHRFAEMQAAATVVRLVQPA
ncbi:MAG: ATPase [Xanthobacteraceae bacterium]|nr:ATPase [Xanthobacteraceae bacterium]